MIGEGGVNKDKIRPPLLPVGAPKWAMYVYVSSNSQISLLVFFWIAKLNKMITLNSTSTKQHRIPICFHLDQLVDDLTFESIVRFQ